jgi:hypothetical protein
MSASLHNCQLPVASGLGQMQPAAHYVDAYAAMLQDPGHKLTAVDAAKAFFLSAPRWLGALMRVRNALVKMAGLKTGNNAQTLEEAMRNFQYLPGQRMGLFEVYASAANEVIMGENDRHLDFRVSVWGEPFNENTQRLVLSTAVVFHNRAGRLYFWLVGFFHRRIVPAMLKAMVSHLQNQHVSPRLRTTHD